MRVERKGEWVNHSACSHKTLPMQERTATLVRYFTS